ncbi:RNA polymerase sigma-70 factor [Echinicola marina]|uniref:RNA polymerase sigma factor n=1 Tax=Echinicola marina TaxID=2859768 RepID=UPI001CF69A67|nr:RNA polymerase sigma-70 factor [Echinicola marina]UCS95447.1 RNA polymerase sigma-70 factor [Echinicola marina]
MFKTERNIDKEKVIALISGSEEAFDHLFRKYSKKIYHVSRKMRLGHEDAEGVVQEVFIKVWNNRERLDAKLSFNAYLIAIVRSIVIRQIQRKAKLTSYQAYQLPFLDEKDTATEDYVIFSDMMDISSKAVESLPPRQKQVFMMKSFDHLSVDEIAEKLQVSRKTVKNQIFRASKSLKEKLMESEIISLIGFMCLVSSI